MEILHVIKTSKYESDGRLLKWIDSLKRFGHSSSVFIIEDKNGVGDYIRDQVNIHKERLWLRKIFRKHSGLLFKAFEQGWKWRRFFENCNADVIVFHDVQQYLNIFITLESLKRRRNRKTTRLIWDLHELPHSELGANSFTKKWLRKLLSGIDLLVYTNNERREFINTVFNHREKNYVVLNNFPDEEFITSSKTPLLGELKDWAEGKEKPYILWMGAATKGRHFNVLLEAYRKYQDRLNLVIMGKIGGEFTEQTRVYLQEGKLFSRFVPQSEVIQYVDNACFSVVLYNASKVNNKLCEPNRLFQLMGRNIPVITGNNPTMKTWVERLDGGIVLGDDGKSVVFLEEAIQRLLSNRQRYVDNLKRVDKVEIFNWRHQFAKVNDFIASK